MISRDPARPPLLALLLAALAASPRAASAQAAGAPPAPPAPAPAAPPEAPLSPGSGAPAATPPDTGPKEVTVVGRPSERPTEAGRAGSRIDRRTLDERMPRSAPDALRFEAGVYVQQTSAGQGSPFVRGRTGQQTLLLYDGIRINTSTYRQGPNQYFFTVDPRTVHSLEVVRGGASTLYGSDALGGVIEARPLEPALDLEATRPVVRPRFFAYGATADGDLGYRLQLDTQITQNLRFLAGIGSRKVGLLESGGPVLSPETGEIPDVPRFAEDGRTQLGTGFREVTADMRGVYGLGKGRRVVAALYLYRQYDAPRTDQCPPPEAVASECLKYDQQFRTLAYAGYRGDLGPIAKSSQLNVSYQRQHERRTRSRPKSFVENGNRDDVDTFGLMAKLETVPITLSPWLSAKLRYGLDTYLDWVSSTAYTKLLKSDLIVQEKRGLYVDGSSYKQGGAFVSAEGALFGGRLIVHGGARGGFAIAHSPGTCDPVTGVCDLTGVTPDAEPLDRAWPAFVGNTGVEYRPLASLSLLANYDRSYRAPNLDDLTAFGLTGAGLQQPNQALEPEREDTFEAGVRVTSASSWPSWPVSLDADVWVYRSMVEDAITRAGRGKNFVQLVNVKGASTIDGVEASARLTMPLGFTARGTLAYTYGKGPNPQDRPSDPTIPYEEVVPLSRMPPLNGTAELRWQSTLSFYLGAALRWATLQDRLAISDRADRRIPQGGTPGFTVFDLRAGYRYKRNMALSLVLENVGDVPYRYHGSAVNGPGRSLSISVEGGL
ncbi:MAG: TonB-dependent receptor [Byssovorax sp.]